MNTDTTNGGQQSAKACPCGKGDINDLERIRRTFLLKTFLFWLPLKRYRCFKCNRKRVVLGNAV